MDKTMAERMLMQAGFTTIEASAARSGLEQAINLENLPPAILAIAARAMYPAVLGIRQACVYAKEVDIEVTA